jgi:hypothetical protein
MPGSQQQPTGLHPGLGKLRQHLLFSLEPVVQRILRGETIGRPDPARTLLNLPLHHEVFLAGEFVLQPASRHRVAGSRIRPPSRCRRVKPHRPALSAATMLFNFALRCHDRTSTTGLEMAKMSGAYSRTPGACRRLPSTMNLASTSRPGGLAVHTVIPILYISFCCLFELAINNFIYSGACAAGGTNSPLPKIFSPWLIDHWKIKTA